MFNTDQNGNLATVGVNVQLPAATTVNLVLAAVLIFVSFFLIRKAFS